MTEKEIEIFLDQFSNKEIRYVLCKSNHPAGSDFKKYTQVYIDKNNVFISINPVDKSFSFEYVTKMGFRLRSGNFSPLDYEDHFKKNYERFTEVALRLKGC